jgi:phospholipid/cholesterol/gamma-HCH transport system ATP-binding protein
MASYAPMQSSPVLEFRNVSIAFDDQPALVDISFKLHKGEMIFVTGESGSGKSVLLRLAIGLLKPDSGQILVGEREIQMLDESELLAIRGGLMGMVFQEDSLLTGLSTYDNVAFRLEEHDWAEQDIQKAVTEVLAFVGLAGEEDKLPEQLSGGMKRRLEIARALVGWPSIMLFDEPTMGLDPARDVNGISSLYVTKKAYELPYLANYIARQEEENRIVIREAPPEALPLTTVMVLESGRIAFFGSLAEFQDSDLPCVTELLTLDQDAYSEHPQFADLLDESHQRNSRCH